MHIFRLYFFRTCISGKLGVAAMLTLKDLAPQNPTKKLAHLVDLLGQFLFRKGFFKIFQARCLKPPTPLTTN